MDRIRTALDVMPDAAVVTDEKGIILAINSEAEDQLGYSPRELEGRPIEVLVPNALVGAHREHRADYHARPRRRRMGTGLEIRAKRRDGTEIPVDISLSPVLTEEGMLVVAALRDVTERKQVEEMKDTFLTALSHELRTPLTAVIGIARTLERFGERLDPEERQQMRELLVRRAMKLDRLLTDLLDLDRLLRGVLEPRRRPTDLPALLKSLLDDLEADDHTIVLEAEPLVADVDAAKVERIVENLVANATRHTPRHSRIWVRVRRAEGGIELVVEDEGAGIPDRLKEEVFEPFRRGDVPDHQPGTGIGLSLVGRFAELHGGRAWVEDRDGGGASFRVFLPSNGRVVRVPEAETESADADPEAATPATP